MTFQPDRKRAATTLHDRLVVQLSAEFATLPPETRLPATGALRERFAVAHMTIVRALSTLADRGEIVRINGKGSFTANRRVDTVYVLTPCPSELWHEDTEVLDGALAAARQHGITIRTIYATLHNNPNEPDFRSLARIPEGAAVLVPNDLWYRKTLDFLVRRRNRVVFIGENYLDDDFLCTRYPNCPRIQLARREAAAEVVQRIAAAGRKRILLIHSSIFRHDPVPRGYRDGLAAAGLPYDETLEISCSGPHSRAYGILEILLLRGEKFDGIVAQHPTTVLGCEDFLGDIGWKIPQDVSIIALKESPMLAAARVPVTAIDYNQYAAGYSAVRMLAVGAGESGDVKIPFKVFKRKSV